MRSKITFILTSFLLGFGLGYFLIDNTNKNRVWDGSEERLSGEYRFINPLLECEPYPRKAKPLGQTESLVLKSIEKIIKQDEAKLVSVYFRDLNNGPWFGINEKELFSPASLIKVPMLLTYLKLAEDDPLLLTSKIKINNEPDYSNQNILPEKKLLKGESYTTEELLERMVLESDNPAYDALFDSINSDRLWEVYSDLGVNISRAFTDPGGNIIRVVDYASFFRVLYNATYLSKDMSEKALELLSKQSFDKGIVAGLPPNIVVSHKFGERLFIETGERQLHDCGIVYVPKEPYLLCIMTRGNDFNKLSGVIAEISKVIYGEIIR